MRNTRALIMMVAAVIAGLGAVIIGARWLSQQATSSANKLVVAGSDIEFRERGVATLAGIPGRRELFAVDRSPGPADGIPVA